MGAGQFDADFGGIFGVAVGRMAAHGQDDQRHVQGLRQLNGLVQRFAGDRTAIEGCEYPGNALESGRCDQARFAGAAYNPLDIGTEQIADHFRMFTLLAEDQQFRPDFLF